MALQINRALTTQTGFDVPSGTYVWLVETRGQNNAGFGYSIKVDVIFFKDKAAFDAGKKRYNPVEVPDSMNSFSQDFTAAEYAVRTVMQVHNYVRTQLESTLGNGTITIVQ